MGNTFLALVIGLLLGTSLIVGPAGAARHDRDCIAGGFGGADAGNTWPVATVLIDFDCTGEVRASQNDNDDWFKVNAPVSGGGDRTIRVCPLSIGLNTNLEVFRQPTIPTVPLNLPPLPPQISMLPAGISVGSSTAAAGCDTVTLPGADNQAGNTVFIHVTRAGGDGLYNLVLA